jgi:integrase
VDQQPAAKRPPNKAKLYDKTIEALAKRAVKEKRPRHLVWDAGQPGLAVVVHPTGQLVYKCIYRRHGRPRWFTIGRSSVVGLADARTRAREILIEVSRGGDPQADRAALRKKGTIEELVPDYVADRKQGKTSKRGRRTGGKSWQQTERLLRLHVVPRWGKLRPGEVAESDVESLLRAYDGKAGMQNAIRAAASGFFGWCIKPRKLIRVNPCENVEKNELDARERELSAAEIKAWWDKLEGQGVRGRALQALLLLGQRPIEIMRMRSEHIEPDGWWDMPGKPDPEKRWPGTKNGRDHRVYLPRAARDIIDRQLGNKTGGLVFRGPNGGCIYQLDVVMREVSTELAKQGLQEAKPHDLRRTHGSNVTRLGFGLEMMDRIQNHIISGTGERHYNRFDYAEPKARAMEAVANRIMGIVEGTSASNVVEGPGLKQARAP